MLINNYVRHSRHWDFDNGTGTQATTNKMKAGTPIMIVLLIRSDVWRYANGLLVVCFNRLPHPCRWDA